MIFRCVQTIESQMFASVVQFIENLIVTPNLSMLGIYYVQMAAFSGNVLFSNQMCSKKGDLVIFIRHIGKSVWFRCMHHSYRPDPTPLDFCLWCWMNSKVDRRKWTHETNCSLAFWMLLTALRSAQSNNSWSLHTNCKVHWVWQDFWTSIVQSSGSFHVPPKICLHIMIV